MARALLSLLLLSISLSFVLAKSYDDYLADANDDKVFGDAISTPRANPHIIVVMLDDIGYADTGIYFKSNIQLPRLKRLASQGVVLDNYYTQTVCSPSRSALLTGKFPFRIGMQHVTTVLPGMASGVPLDVPLIPDLLKPLGYTRHMIGKWHLGYATWEHTPLYRGFETYTGYLQAQGDYYKHNVQIFGDSKFSEKVIDGLDFWDGRRPYFEAVGNYSLDIYRSAQRKVLADYARKNPTPADKAKQPFFLYLAHQTVHIPLQSRKDEIERCGHLPATGNARRVYCSMLVEMDDLMGELEDLLRRYDMWDNTLILLSTDNSGMTNWKSQKNGVPKFPASQGSNYPFRGGKTTMLEGGVRSTAFISGGYVPKAARGTRHKGLMHVVDLTAIALRAAGVFPLERESLQIDGVDFSDSIFGAPGAPSGLGRDHVPINIIQGGTEFSAVRFGQYKLILDNFKVSSANGWFDQNGQLLEKSTGLDQKIHLFDLENDPQERRDISAERPDLVKHGKDLIQSYVRGPHYMEPQSYRDYLVRASPRLHGGVWKPFMSKGEWDKFWKVQQNRKPYKPKSLSSFDDEENEEEELYAGRKPEELLHAESLLTTPRSALRENELETEARIESYANPADDFFIQIA